MSIIANIDTLEYETREKIAKDLQIKLEGSSYFSYIPKISYVYPFEVVNDSIYLPFSYTVKEMKFPRPTRESFPQTNVQFVGSLRNEQKEIRSKAFSYLNKRGSCLISAYTGCGKTCVSIYIASKIRMKTLVIVNRLILIEQWKKSIEKFCTSVTVQKLTTKSKKKDVDFYIINAQNVEKLGREFFKDIGTVIVDESHCILAELLSRSLQYVCPRYLIGLSATPYRPDGMDALFDFYFGDGKIHKKLYHPHLVYKVNTGFKPETRKNKLGKLDWSFVLESQAFSQDRNKLIVRLVKEYSDRNFLILCKRVAQAEILVEMLEEEKEDVTILVRSKKEFDCESRILVATIQKAGIGFDHPKLDTLLIAADVEEYFIQYLGRVFRRRDVKPIIFDLIDENYTMKRHFKTRQKIYTDAGGDIRVYKGRLLK